MQIKLKSCPNCDNTQIDYWDEADGFYYCEPCGLCGPRAKDRTEAASKWNSLPRKLKWTKEKPKEHGWYRVKIPTKDITIVLIKNEMIETIGGRYILHEFCRDLYQLWSDPIPEPTE